MFSKTFFALTLGLFIAVDPAASASSLESPFLTTMVLYQIPVIQDSMASVLREKSRNPGDPTLRLKEIILYHNLSLHGFQKGQSGFAEKSFEAAQSFVADAGVSAGLRAVAAAYRGSARALMGNETGNPFKKIYLAKDGIKFLDKAVQDCDAASYVPRFLRQSVYASLPGILGKAGVAKSDGEELEKRLRQKPEYLPPAIASLVFVNQGNLYAKETEMKKAAAYWEMAVRLAPEEKSGKDARGFLDKAKVGEK